jgi:adenosylcobinamide kinase/adenosylcobinamide-phosphate guanylyltransferase
MAPAAVIRQRGACASVLVLDCVTLWVSNLLLAGLSDGEILGRVGELEAALDEASCSVALVTNEVGWGVVPDHPLGRRFRDLAGSVNQRLAQVSDEVVLMVAGLPMRVK